MSNNKELDTFSINERVIWDSRFGYEVGYFLGEGILEHSFLIDIKSGHFPGQCSYSKDEVFKYTNEHLQQLQAKYGYLNQLQEKDNL